VCVGCHQSCSSTSCLVDLLLRPSQQGGCQAGEGRCLSLEEGEGRLLPLEVGEGRLLPVGSSAIQFPMYPVVVVLLVVVLLVVVLVGPSLVGPAKLLWPRLAVGGLADWRHGGAWRDEGPDQRVLNFRR